VSKYKSFGNPLATVALRLPKCVQHNSVHLHSTTIIANVKSEEKKLQESLEHISPPKIHNHMRFILCPCLLLPEFVLQPAYRQEKKYQKISKLTSNKTLRNA
jgi:hypothetical protein